MKCLTLRTEAMATAFEVQFAEGEVSTQAALKTFEQVAELEDQLTVYRDESEVSWINRRAAAEPMRVEKRLFALLLRCQHFFRETERVLDITAGPLIKTWGFFRRQGRLPGEAEIAQAMELVGMDHVELNETLHTIRFDRPEIELNLGAVGKGYALDRVAESWSRGGLGPALFAAGRSSVLAVGRPPWDDAWRIALEHPTRSETLGTLALVGQALSTSGVREQSFVHDGQRYSHVLDPRTGWPARGMLQATAVAPDATWAEALSTAFFIHGADWAANYCARNPGIGGILVEAHEPDPPKIVGQVEWISRE